MNKTVIILLSSVLSLAFETKAQESLSLCDCIDYAVENNINLQKDKLAKQSAYQSKREILGALLPQLSASAGFTDNIQKTKITMPNFVNDMLPEAMRDPNASKYMSVTMGTDLTANWGVSLSQQILNFSLINAVGIAKTAEEMAQTGIEISTKEVIAQTATLYYNIQILKFAISKFDESLDIMEKTKNMMEVFQDNGIIRKVDADQIQVTLINLQTEKMNLELAIEAQSKLLKLQMGYDVETPLALEDITMEHIEETIYLGTLQHFDATEQLPFKMVEHQKQMLTYQRRAAVSETLPVLVLTGTYQYNYLGDEFKGPTYQHFPVSMAMLNLKMPIFTGFSKNAKIKKADIELQKAEKDEALLVQSLTMAYGNALKLLEQNRKAVEAQRKNKDLAQEVMEITDKNYSEGLASLSDLLNANSSFIKAQSNYASALGTCIKAYIDLKKVDGTIQDIK